MENEIWVPIKGYEGLYEVSSFGRVRSLNYHRTGQKKVLSAKKNKKGYLEVFLFKNGKGKTFLIHRLVATAFIPNWFDDTQVNHRDENKINNNIDNLEWCDAKHNDNHGTRNIRISEKLSKPVLQFSKTGELLREWSSTMEIGRNGFNQCQIVNCCNGKRKNHKGYIWKYKEVI